MNLKNLFKYLAILVIVGLIVVGIVFTVKKEKPWGADLEKKITVEEDNSTSTSIKEKDVTSLTNMGNENYYVSSSATFPKYSFVCPDGWVLFEEGGGSRVIVKNRSDSNSSSDEGSGDEGDRISPVESILVIVEDSSKFKDKNEDRGSQGASESGIDLGSKIRSEYLEVAENLNESTLVEDTASINRMRVELLGYVYDSLLNDSSGGVDVDMLTYVEKDGYVYIFKYMGSNVEKEKSRSTFKNFLSTVSFDPEGESVIKDEKSPSMNILILGDDSAHDRPGGRVSGRTDIIILFHINLETYKGTMVTIPRDTWVEIPGHGEGKINGAHAMGGMDLTIKTIEQFSGLEIDNYVITDFDGFVPLVDFLGGVTIEVEEDLADGFSGCYLNKGINHLNGEQALALCRNRHRSGGAYARERESARVILALYEQNSSLKKILKLPAFINYLLEYTWTDFDFMDILKLIPVLGRLDPQNIEITTIPSWPQMVGNASAVVYDKEETQRLFEKVKNQ
ncbi:MAG: LCP family protein [Actinobacteria bacterium]|nr:LCP family protein [Actinomycetota bacterium]